MNKKIQAFTLVELAIVIVIIGLLVGGVLQGQELIRQARIQSAVKQVNSILTAMNTYKAKYGFLPGDDSRATTYFTASGIINGDGNNRIFSLLSAVPPSCLSSGARNGSDTEVSMFFIHLSLAKMINMKYALANLYLGDFSPEFLLVRTTFILPTCIDVSDDGGAVLGSGQYYILGATDNTNINNQRMMYKIPSTNSNTGAQATAIDLYSFDKKIDDGLPSTGILKVMAGCDYNLSAYTVTNDNCKSTTAYKWD